MESKTLQIMQSSLGILMASTILTVQKKTILLVPHIGCWEITGRVLAEKRKVTFMYRPLRSNKQNDYLFSRRNQGNLTMASADKLGILKIQRALNKW